MALIATERSPPIPRAGVKRGSRLRLGVGALKGFGRHKRTALGGRRLCHFCNWRTRLLHSHPASELAFSTLRSANQKPGAILHGSRPQSAWCRPSLPVFPPSSSSISIIIAAASCYCCSSASAAVWSSPVSFFRRPLQRHCSRSGLRFQSARCRPPPTSTLFLVPFFESAVHERAPVAAKSKARPAWPALVLHCCCASDSHSFPRRPTPIHPLHCTFRASAHGATRLLQRSRVHQLAGPSIAPARPPRRRLSNPRQLIVSPSCLSLASRRYPASALDAIQHSRVLGADQHHGAGALLHIVFPSSPRPSPITSIPSRRILLVLLPPLGAARAVFTVITTQHHQHQHQHHHPIPYSPYSHPSPPSVSLIVLSARPVFFLHRY